MNEFGKSMIDLMKELWPICRSITGDGVRNTLLIINKKLLNLNILEVPSGTPCFDWIIPKEWSIRNAFVVDPDGNKIIDFKENNLHVLGYSVPVDKVVDLKELETHLFSIANQKDAIPYVTSYYKENWGFCIKHSLREKLIAGKYQVRIDSELFDGKLTYGELVIPGVSSNEILISTYICHPSMANNELSGPCLATEISNWISKQPRRYTYRILFLPETIGAIYYVSKHLSELKSKVKAGFILTCVGDERCWSFMPTRNGNTLTDKVSRHILSHYTTGFTEYSFLERGSDERQYCSPGVDLPVASVMRSKYGTYPEYHTSLDNFELVTEKGMQDSFELYVLLLETIENHCFPKVKILCEPMLSKRRLKSPVSNKNLNFENKTYLDLAIYSDGKKSLLEIAEILGISVFELYPIAKKLESQKILSLKYLL